MTRIIMIVAALAVALAVSPARAEPLIWGVKVEQLEHRFSDGSDVRAWDADAFVGSDELRFVVRSEAEYETKSDTFETLENQARAQIPISTFFDAVAGVRVDTPKGRDRIYGAIGTHGLAPQWFEVDLDLYLSDKPVARAEIEYEALLTNYLILTPSLEIDLPLADDAAVGNGALGPKAEVGLRLSYDLIDRSVAPYIGVHYERKFGESKDIALEEGEAARDWFVLAGVRLMF